MKKGTNLGYKSLLSSVLALTLMGCGSSSSNGGDTQSSDANLLVHTMIDMQTSFINLARMSDSYVGNGSGIEVATSATPLWHDGKVYVLEGGSGGDKLYRYRHENKTLIKEAELSMGEEAGASAITFVNATKAYISLMNRGELLVLDLTDLTITKRLDLGKYALNDDGNPEPTEAIIRDGKLYLTLQEFDQTTYDCSGDAHVIVIDTATDAVLSETTDARACIAGSHHEGTSGMFMDEVGDIYVYNAGAFGYHAGRGEGLLRIKKGSDQFDPDYHFSFKTQDLTGEIAGGAVSYANGLYYTGNGKLYAYLNVPAFSSNPPDYANDRNFQPFEIDIKTKVIKKLPLPAGVGWNHGIYEKDNALYFALSGVNGDGLYRYDMTSKTGGEAPALQTEGTPLIAVPMQ